MKTCKQCNLKFEIMPEDKVFYNKISVPEPQTCPKCRLKRRFNERNHRTLYRRKCDSSGENIISQYHEKQPFPVYKTEVWNSDSWDAEKFGRNFDFKRPFFEQFKELKNQIPHPATYIIAGTLENSEYTNNTGYIKNCYLIAESDYDENCYYSNLLKHCKDVVDCSVCYEDQLCYECVDCMGCYSLKFSQDSESCIDSYFLLDCHGCSDCIACVNQRNAKNRIFNKQYSKEQYEKMKKEFALDTTEGIQKMRQKAKGFFLTQPHRYAQVLKNENSLGEHLYNSKNAYWCF